MSKNLKSACGSMLRRNAKQACWYFLGTIGGIALIAVSLILTNPQTSMSGFEFFSIAYIIVMTFSTFHGNFHNLMQNGFTRKTIFASSICMTVVISAAVAALDTVSNNLAHFGWEWVFGNRVAYESLFGVNYEYGNYPMQWLYIFTLLLALSMTVYLMVVLFYKFKYKAAIGFGIFWVTAILFLSAILSHEKAITAIMTLLGFTDSGINYLYPIGLFFGVAVIFALISRAIFVRLEVKN